MTAPSPATVLAALKGVRARLNDPAHWTQGNNAIDRFGPISAYSPRACAFCLVGACHAEAAKYFGLGSSPPTDDGEINLAIREFVVALFKELAKHLPAEWTRERNVSDGQALVEWNDWHDRTHAQVMDLLYTTIDHLEPDRLPQ